MLAAQGPLIKGRPMNQLLCLTLGDWQRPVCCMACTACRCMQHACAHCNQSPNNLLHFVSKWHWMVSIVGGEISRQKTIVGLWQPVNDMHAVQSYSKYTGGLSAADSILAAQQGRGRNGQELLHT